MIKLSNRGFGLEIEENYGTKIDVADFDLDFWNEANDVDFKLNDDLVTKSGSSRMNKRSRPGYLKPSGSTSADADLQQLAWYFFGYLDNYQYLPGQNGLHIHEYWGGEGKQLPSFRGLALYDNLKKYLFGLILDQLKFEVTDEGMSVGAEWLYKTEEARIIGRKYPGTPQTVGGVTLTPDVMESFEEPDELVDEDLFIMPYDIAVKLNGNILDGSHDGAITNGLTFEGNNNHDIEKTLGMSSRAPQIRPPAQKRENNLSVTTLLSDDTVDTILAAQYGDVNITEPSLCKIMKVPFEIDITHCEKPGLLGHIEFPKCTLRVDFNFSGVDAVEATISLDTLGSGSVTLASGSQVVTDMYVKLVNNQPKLLATQ